MKCEISLKGKTSDLQSESAGSIPVSRTMYVIKVISKDEAFRLIWKFHYNNTLPRLIKHCLGGFVNGELVAVMTLGWGVRPLHTIRKLFPSLTAQDYYENGRMCLDDKMPRNSESQFISECVKFIKQHYPNIKVLFSWSDGMLGKPGYVYQASGFLYGGYIWTDSYFSKKGERIHPRQTNRIGGRPTWGQMNKLDWLHFRGKQFKYCRFICSHKERKQLLRESTVKWTMDFPKEKDLAWKVRTLNGWEESKKPFYDSNELVHNKKIGEKRKALLYSHMSVSVNPE